jgi:hypothetical protein
MADKVELSAGTKGEFELTVSVLLLTEDGKDYIDSINDFEGDNAFKEARDWAIAQGYEIVESKPETVEITWSRKPPGYEVSSIGDRRFSALFALMPDGRTIEQWYQCDIKGYDIGGRNWKLGNGQPPLINFSQYGQSITTLG